MGDKATYQIDCNVTPRCPAAFTCLHVVVVTDDFPGGPESVVTGFAHLVQLVLDHVVTVQTQI